MRIQPSQLTALQISETKYRVDVLTNHEHIASTLSFFDTMEWTTIYWVNAAWWKQQ